MIGLKRMFIYRNVYVVLALKEEINNWLVYFGFEHKK